MRVRLCAFVGVATAALLALVTGSAAATSAPASASCPATAFAENAAHNGHTCTTLSPVLWQRWRKQLNGYPSAPIIAGGRVFVETIGSSGVWLYALSAANGNTLWGPVPLASTVAFPLAYDNGRVFAGDPQGTVRAFAAATGQQLWARPTEWAMGPPTAVGGRVYVKTGPVWALSEATGALVWRSPKTDGGDSLVSADTTGVYLSTGCGSRFKLGLGTGAIIWRGDDDCTGGGDGVASLWGSRLFGSDGQRVLDKATGQLRGSFAGAPAFNGTSGFFAVHTYVYSEDVATGTPKWTVDLGESHVGPPVATANGLVIVLTARGHLIGLNGATGKRVFIRSVPGVARGIGVFNPRPGFAVGNGAVVAPSGNALVLLR